MGSDAGKGKPTITYLGPKGTFSEEAVMTYWGENAEYVPSNNFTSIFEKTYNGDTDYGVIPTEDSEYGDVQESLDLLEDYPLYIVKELHHEVKHYLLGKVEKDEIDKIKTIGSHRKPLTHCRKYLFTQFPHVKQETMDSTGAAAKKASEDPTFGAIASKGNAELYGLNILAEEIHDKGSNKTRFFTMSTKELYLGDISHDTPFKTSICVHVKTDEPGVLVEILNVFSKRKINLTRVVSRPAGGDFGNYKFFLDIEGRKDEPTLASALEELDALESVMYFRDFGSYPVIKEGSPIEEAQSTPIDLLASTFSFWDNEEDRIYDSL